MRTGNESVKKVKKKKYKIDYLRVLLIVCLVYFSVTCIKQQLEINEYNVKINAINQDIDYANEQIAELNAKKEKVNDSEYLEQIAREELGLVKPYEKIFIDVDK